MTVRGRSRTRLDLDLSSNYRRVGGVDHPESHLVPPSLRTRCPGGGTRWHNRDRHPDPQTVLRDGKRGQKEIRTLTKTKREEATKLSTKYIRIGTALTSCLETLVSSHGGRSRNLQSWELGQPYRQGFDCERSWKRPELEQEGYLRHGTWGTDENVVVTRPDRSGKGEMDTRVPETDGEHRGRNSLLCLGVDGGRTLCKIETQRMNLRRFQWLENYRL